MDYKNIYEVLEKYEYNKGKRKRFIELIEKYKDSINTIDDTYGMTPIAYYCTKRLNSHVNPDVVEILISFGAKVDMITNPNTNPNRNPNIMYDNTHIPLNILVKGNNENYNQNNIDAIKLLLPYTNIRSLTCEGYSYELFAHIIMSPEILVNKEEVIDFYSLVHGFSNLVGDKYGNAITVQKNLYDTVENILIRTHFPDQDKFKERISIVIQYILFNYIVDDKPLFDIKVLLSKSIEQKNLVLIDYLMNMYAGFPLLDDEILDIIKKKKYG